jgi:hypothetical protein
MVLKILSVATWVIYVNIEEYIMLALTCQVNILRDLTKLWVVRGKKAIKEEGSSRFLGLKTGYLSRIGLGLGVAGFALVGHAVRH